VVIVLAVLVVGVFACARLLPERYAVNVPVLGTLFGADPPEASELQKRMVLPEGFAIELFAEGLPNARFLRFTRSGDLLVSSPREHAVFLLEPDRDGDGRSDGQRRVLEELHSPHGLDFLGEWLYIGETDAIRRVRFDHERGAAVGELETIVADLPGTGNHWTKTVRFGPDGWMYVSIGSSCNVCIEEDPLRATIVRYRPDGSELQIHATGLRNSVGFDWRPATDELFATDNGRDLLGDDFPPCELNRIVAGGFYGWPFANGAKRIDPDLGAGHEADVARSIAPVHGFVGHTAPLGMTFYRGDAFPARYRGAAFVAQHGSWNRTRKSGYRVVALHWDADDNIEESDFVLGWELDEQVIGRPVDLAEGPDGALYVSDDYAGAVYRVSYRGD
jgi:glucose/arabinose dehydrogenase